MFVVVTEVARLVCAAIGQVPVCPMVLVKPASVTEQLVVPMAMAMPVKPLNTLVPLL